VEHPSTGQSELASLYFERAAPSLCRIVRPLRRLRRNDKEFRFTGRRNGFEAMGFFVFDSVDAEVIVVHEGEAAVGETREAFEFIAIQPLLHEIDFSAATNLIGTKLTDDDIVKATPIGKKLKVDLVKKGLNRDKFEGLACLADGSFALVNDDDFGIDGIEDKETHRLKAVPSPRKAEFFIVSP
jgi:hypothetical protein